MKDIAVFGAGGFGREVACMIKRINKAQGESVWNFIGFFDDNEKLKGTENEYGKVLGGMSELNAWGKPLCIVIAIGTAPIIKKVAEKFDNPKLEFPNLIDPDVTFFDEDNVKFGKGNLILAKCLISTNVSFGDFNILNANDGIGHDVSIGNYNCMMPNVNISGGVKIGECNFFGVKSTVLQYFKIGNNTKIGADSVIMRNTKDGKLYMGNPAKKVEL